MTKKEKLYETHEKFMVKHYDKKTLDDFTNWFMVDEENEVLSHIRSNGDDVVTHIYSDMVITEVFKDVRMKIVTETLMLT